MGNCGSTKKKEAVFEPAVPPPSKVAAPPTKVPIASEKPKSILKTSSPAAEEADRADNDDKAAQKIGKDFASDVISDALVKLEAMCSKTLLIQDERAAADAVEKKAIAELAASVTSGAIADALRKHAAHEALAAQRIQAGCRGATARQEASHKRAIAEARAPPKVVVEKPKPKSSPKLAATSTEASPAPRATGGDSPPDMSPVPSPLVAAMKADAPPEVHDSEEPEANEWLSGHLSHMRSQSSLQRQKSGNLQRKKSGSTKGKKNSRGARNSHEEGAVEAQRSVYIKN